MGKLILVRHGETDKNVNNKLHAFDDSETLNETGREQIKKAADKLKEFTPNKVFSSKEKRAVASTEIISSLLKIPMEIVEGMQERNWGVFTGKPWSEVEKILKPMTLEERYQYVPENGESWKVFEERLIKRIQQITRDNKDKTVVVVTHGGAIRALMPFLTNVRREESFKYDPENASLTIFNYDEKGFYKL